MVRGANALRQRGFTYLGLIILVSIIGLAATAALQVGAIAQRRDAEQELLQIGREYYDALISYRNATPAGQSDMPASVEDLLIDPRFPDLRRHLRKLYIDPMTGNNEWGLVQGVTASGSGIVGFYSLSEARPIKIDNFEAVFAAFKGKTSYRDWVFTSQPPLDPLDAPAAPATPTAPAAPKAPRPKMTPAQKG